MLRPIWLLALSLVACTPSLNWREVTVEATDLDVMLPCKPDTVERRIPVAPGKEWVVHATGCEAGGATFAVLHADVGAAGELAAALAQWRAANLANMHAQPSSEGPWVPRGALGLPQSTRLRAQAQRSDGSTLQMDAAYFARGTQVYQVAVYAPRVTREMTEPFFAGLRFR